MLATRTSFLSADQRELLIAALQPLSSFLEDEVAQQKGWRAMTLVETLLFLWFAREEQALPWTQIELTAQQDCVLSLFSDRSDIWNERKHTYDFLDVLRAYRLPDEQKVMADFLKRELSLSMPLTEQQQRTTFPLPSRHNTFDHYLLRIFQQHFSRLYPDLFIASIGSALKPMGQLLTSDTSGFEACLYKDHSRYEVFFHVPDSPAAVWELKREYQLLRLLQERVPLPVPRPLYVDLEAAELGRIFLGYRCFSGRPLYKETWDCLERIEGEEFVKTLAHQIAAFLYMLHHFPVAGLAPLALPVIHQRTSYEALYKRVRLDLFPHLSQGQRAHLSASFGTFLDTPHNFTLTPVLVHGTFGSHRMLFDGKEHAMSGVIGFTHAGLGDPASDIAPLFGPTGYGKKFRQFFEEAYPNFPTLRERVQFYVNAALLQEACSRYGQQQSKEIARELPFYSLA